MKIYLTLILCSLIFLSAESFALENLSRGEIFFETRKFKSDHSKTTNDQAISLFTRLDHSSQIEKIGVSLRGYARVDQKNTSRNILSLEDTFVSYDFGERNNLTVAAGSKIFNWTATEAFHPADIVNSRNFDSDLENLEKIGEYNLSLEWKDRGHKLSLYFFPHYQRPRLPGKENRLGAGIDLDRAVWVDNHHNDKNSWGGQYGIRYETTLSSADISLFAIKHQDRTYPLIGTENFSYVSTLLVPSGVIPRETTFRPYYFKTFDFGLTYQQAIGRFILKMESVYKDFLSTRTIYTARGLRDSHDHGETAVGIEYDYTTDGGIDLQFFCEGQALYGADKIQLREKNAFQRDLMFGIRLAFNDVKGSEIFLSMISDIEYSHQYLGNIVFMRRLSDEWKFKVGMRYFDAPKRDSVPVGLEILDQDHFLFFNLMRYF